MKYIKFIVETGLIVGSTISSTPPEVYAGQSYIEVSEDTPTDPFRYIVVDGAVVLRDEPIIPPTLPRVYSFNEWVDRFPLATQVAIVAASMSNPVVKLIYDRAMAADFIDPADPRTIASTNELVTQGVISQGDADEALAP